MPPLFVSAAAYYEKVDLYVHYVDQLVDNTWTSESVSEGPVGLLPIDLLVPYDEFFGPFSNFEGL